ncbi:MAG TPA: polysaccharide deacetylase family protein [Armatimonadota bacterium]|jgi:peptidoglycan/xylan/chitin deacetylase (PgdA/CDA1 family)
MRPFWPLIGVVCLAGCAGYRRTTANRPPAPVPAATTASSEPPALAPTDGRMWLNGSEDVAVLMYHDVVPRKQVWFDVTNREFEAQMASLKEAGANVAKLEDVVAHFRDGTPLPPKTVVLTFDDNTVGIYENAFPIMRKYGFPSTQFVHTAYVGVQTEKGHCSWDQLKEMEDSGLVDVESHTVNHPPDIRILSDDEARAELVDSKAAIEEHLGHPVRFLAYTEGNADERIAAMVKEAGYEAAFNEQRAWMSGPVDRLFLPRFAPFRFDDVLDHWKESAAVPVRGLARVDLQAPGDGLDGLRTPAGVRVTWDRTPLDNIRATRGGDAIIGPDGFAPVPVERQWGLIGRPLFVTDGRKAMCLPYQPWLGTSDAALNELLPGATKAVIGSRWILHNGQPIPGDDRSIRRASVFGWTQDGRPFLGHAQSRVRPNDLAAALQTMGATEAIAL